MRRKEPRMGWAPVGSVVLPFTESKADIECNRETTFRIDTKSKNVWNIAWWADPVLLGDYPKDAFAGYGVDAPTVLQEDMETICQPLDFYEANIYTASIVKSDAHGKLNGCPVLRAILLTLTNGLLHHLLFTGQEGFYRILKDSAYHYGSIIKSRGAHI